MMTLNFNLLTLRSRGEHSRLKESLGMKCRDDRSKGKEIMRHKPFSEINAL